MAERSAGNPLFVEELLRTWAGVGILVAEGEICVICDSDAVFLEARKGADGPIIR